MRDLDRRLARVRVTIGDQKSGGDEVVGDGARIRPHLGERGTSTRGDAVVAEYHEATQQLAGGALLDRVQAGVDALRAPADDAGHPTDPVQGVRGDGPVAPGLVEFGQGELEHRERARLDRRGNEIGDHGIIDLDAGTTCRAKNCLRHLPGRHRTDGVGAGPDLGTDRRILQREVEPIRPDRRDDTTRRGARRRSPTRVHRGTRHDRPRRRSSTPLRTGRRRSRAARRGGQRSAGWPGSHGLGAKSARSTPMRREAQQSGSNPAPSRRQWPRRIEATAPDRPSRASSYPEPDGPTTVTRRCWPTSAASSAATPSRPK